MAKKGKTEERTPRCYRSPTRYVTKAILTSLLEKQASPMSGVALYKTRKDAALIASLPDDHFGEGNQVCYAANMVGVLFPAELMPDGVLVADIDEPSHVQVRVSLGSDSLLCVMPNDVYFGLPDELPEDEDEDEDE